MEEILNKSHIVVMEKGTSVILDIESLAPLSDISTGNSKMTRVLSRKGSSRIDRRNSEADEESKKLVVKVAAAPLEPSKQPASLSKLDIPVASGLSGCSLSDSCEGKNKHLSVVSLRPRRVLLTFASLSSLGTLILIYFTLALNRGSGS